MIFKLKKMFWMMPGMVLCLLVSCGSGYLKPDAGAVARKEAQIAIKESIPDGLLQNEDISIRYKVEQKGAEFTLVGKLMVGRSLTDSFPIVSNLFLYISFLDATGKVLETSDITPLYSALNPVPDVIDIKATLPLPAGCKAFVFHYDGKFQTTTMKDGGYWNIRLYPFK
jgi:hypothetical protein